jgi:hypothetical protein
MIKLLILVTVLSRGWSAFVSKSPILDQDQRETFSDEKQIHRGRGERASLSRQR